MLTIIFFIAAIIMFFGCVHQANMIPGRAPARLIIGLVMMMAGDMLIALLALYKIQNCDAVAWVGNSDLGMLTLMMAGMSFWLFGEKRMPIKREESHG